MADPMDQGRRALLAGGAVALAATTAAGAQSIMPAADQNPPLDWDTDTRARLARLDPSLPARLQRSAAGVGKALDRRSLALVRLASHAALGDAAGPYEARVRAAAAAGVEPDEIVEVGLHALVYAGFPAAQAAMQRTQAVFRADRVQYRARSGRPRGNDRALGLANLRQTGGEAFARAWIADPSEFDELALRFAHGEVWNRPALPVRDRGLVTLPMLLASGDLEAAFTFHVAACRRLGWSRDAIVDCMVVAASDIGLPRLLAVIEPVVAGLERSLDLVAVSAVPRAADADQVPSDAERLRRGQKALDGISQSSGQSVVSSFDEIAPDLGRYILEFPYGEVFSRPGLDLKSRELATVAALTATGRTVDGTPLAVHVNAALNVGASPREVTEVIFQMIPYAGFPRVEKAIAAADKVFAERRLTLAPQTTTKQPNLTIIGRLHAKRGRGGELKEALLPVVAASRREPGCINYDLHVDVADPNAFVIYENWVDQAALDRHFKQPHSVALAARLPELLEKPLTMERLGEISDWIGRKST